MVDMPRLTPQTVAVLRAFLSAPATPRWGRDIANETGLKSGTLHPILARLEGAGLVESFWEEPSAHEDQKRPRRRYYRLCADGAENVRFAIASQPQSSRITAGVRLRPQPEM